MNIEILEKVKKLVIRALVADEQLMGVLVLKGGNALNLAYDLTSRGSIDIDFSIESDFTERDKKTITSQAKILLNEELNPQHLQAIDVKFTEKPKKIDPTVEDFWGGYELEFKIIHLDLFKEHKSDIEKLRRNAIPLGRANSTKFKVEISKYEYVAKKAPKDIEGATVYVYSPEMLAFEKMRAICQQVDDYKKIVKVMTSKSRARDFYDIHNILESFRIDLTSKENTELLKNIFDAKRVDVSLIGKIESKRELHRQSWDSVLETINQNETPRPFDYYFEYIKNKFEPFLKLD